MKWPARLYLLFACILAVSPLVWYGLSSVKGSASFPGSLLFSGRAFTIENYEQLFMRGHCLLLR